MRLRITHETTYRYDRPIDRAIEILRLTPQNHNGQYVSSWRLDVSTDGLLTRIEDPFGNIAHSLSFDGPLEQLVITAGGEVVTNDTAGIVRGLRDRLPSGVFLRPTEFTDPTPAIRELAAALNGQARDPLDFLHRLNMEIFNRFLLAPARHGAVRPAGSVLADAEEPATPQDLAHLFITAAREAHIPTRYVSGYLHRPEAFREADAGHAWVEAFVEELGWIAFDPSLGMCPVDAHVRVSIGLDCAGAASIRGSRAGGGAEDITVNITVEEISHGL